jgi:uncharacterized protein YbjT (DUF2867 family)
VAIVLIIGASRGIGLETVRAALAAGHSVRALARSARRIPVDHPKLEKMPGDALEMATVKRALTGVDVVTQSLGVSAGPEIILKPTRFFSKATRVLVTAMEEGQVKRLISVTGFGAGDSRGRGGFLYNATFHLLLGRVYDDKDVQERIIRSSKLDWVIVRPVILTDGPKTNAYRALVDPRDWTCGFISRADVSDFLVKQINSDAFLHKTPVLTSWHERRSRLIVPAGILAQIHRKAIIAMATRHRLPAVYPYRFFAADGSLVSYGLDLTDQYRRAAAYVDRILKGWEAADLPVPPRTKYELVINLKTAKALGLDVPATLLARADEVIEFFKGR